MEILKKYWVFVVAILLYVFRKKVKKAIASPRRRISRISRRIRSRIPYKVVRRTRSRYRSRNRNKRSGRRRRF